jgi:hypothetical protein
VNVPDFQYPSEQEVIRDKKVYFQNAFTSETDFFTMSEKTEVRNVEKTINRGISCKKNKVIPVTGRGGL